MSFIREREQELTGFQESRDYNSNFDVQCDFVMVYGTDKDMPKRVKHYQDQGYVVHLMTGIAWGEYQDYLFGEYDGRSHWDEAQVDRNGNRIQHGENVPYMVPTIAFADYLTEKIKRAIDAGVVAIHLEEPEFWDRGGYSEAFKREYECYYRMPWQPPHTNLDTMYKAAKLKAYLYARTLDRVFGALKEYGRVKYNKTIRFYVPTHSLLNYTQWKIMSPEGALIDLPTVDGYIAQIWTGTSRSENVFEGICKERTFETAFLEYGIMQELVSGTGRRMWFLHDPIEDNARYSWEDYEYNYKKTVVASLLHPNVHHYEICPWPNRVFNGKYPVQNGKVTEHSKPIPRRYNTVLNNIFQMLGNMDQDEWKFEGDHNVVGVFMSDSCLYQRSYPDHLLAPGTHYKGFEQMSLEEKYAFITSGALPDFYGLTLPLLKYGLPVRPIQLDNLRRFPGYLKDYKTLILSYEFLKPESPDINNALAAWVRQGGTLIYVGDSTDPYHEIQHWWNQNDKKYKDPAHHLFEMLGFDENLKEGIHDVGKGTFAFICKRGVDFCLNHEAAEDFRNFIKLVLKKNHQQWHYTNHLALRRGPYMICAAMDESVNESYELQGLFVDMFSPEFDVIEKKTIHPDENAVLYDLESIEGEDFAIIGTTNRIESFNYDILGFEVCVKGASNLVANLRMKLPAMPKEVLMNGEVLMTWKWDEASQTVLIQYESCPEGASIVGKF